MEHLLLLVPLAGLAVGARLPIRDNSFLWHVRAGGLQLQAGEVLRADPFSYTAGGAPWRTQSWLPELVYGLLESWTGGLGWVAGMLVALGGLTLLLAGLAVYAEADRVFPTALVLGGITLLALPVIVPRPVLWSFPLLAGLVVVLQRWERLAWTVPLILWLWSGVHASFIIGLGLVALEALRHADSIRSRLGALAACVAAVSVGAHGLRIWEIPFVFFANREALELLQEWAVPRPTDPVVWPYLAVIALLFLAATAGRMSRRDLWVVVPFVLFGLTAQRTLLPAALVVAPLAARALRGFGFGSSPTVGSRVTMHWLVAAALVVGAVWSAVRPVAIDRARFPSEAVQHLSGTRLFHDVATGGYLIYAAWPERRVLIDDRAELYGPELFQRVVAAEAGAPAWTDLFQEYGVDEVLLRREHGLIRVLEDRGWSMSHRDARFVILRAP